MKHMIIINVLKHNAKLLWAATFVVVLIVFALFFDKIDIRILLDSLEVTIKASKGG